MDKKWRHVMFSHVASAKLWRRYLSHTTSHLARFKVSNSVSQYLKCLEVLKGIKAGTFTSHHMEPLVAENALFSVFADSCRFWVDAGYSERAVAAYQAILDFNLCCPKDYKLQALSGKTLVFFETYWESGTSRIGEEGERGCEEGGQEGGCRTDG